MIGDNLKEARKRNSYTQVQVGHKLRVSPKTISSWENNRSSPDFTFIVQLSDLYNTPLDSLLRTSQTIGPTPDITKENALCSVSVHWTSYLVIVLTVFRAGCTIARCFGIITVGANGGLLNILLLLAVFACIMSHREFIKLASYYLLPTVLVCTGPFSFILNTFQLSNLPFSFLSTNTDNVSYIAGALLSSLLLDIGIFCSMCAFVHLYFRVQSGTYKLSSTII